MEEEIARRTTYFSGPVRAGPPMRLGSITRAVASIISVAPPVARALIASEVDCATFTRSGAHRALSALGIGPRRPNEPLITRVERRLPPPDPTDLFYFPSPNETGSLYLLTRVADL
jgi:hypothetical protein